MTQAYTPPWMWRPPSGCPNERVFKTLVALPDQPNAKPVLAVIPGPANLDLKLLAKALGVKKARMASHAQAESLTGLQTGGISPLALVNRGFKVYLDTSATEHATIAVSAGQRGVNLELDPDDLMAVTGARLAQLCGRVNAPVCFGWRSACSCSARLCHLAQAAWMVRVVVAGVGEVHGAEAGRARSPSTAKAIPAPVARSGSPIRPRASVSASSLMTIGSAERSRSRRTKVGHFRQHPSAGRHDDGRKAILDQREGTMHEVGAAVRFSNGVGQLLQLQGKLERGRIVVPPARSPRNHACSDSAGRPPQRATSTSSVLATASGMRSIWPSMAPSPASIADSKRHRHQFTGVGLGGSDGPLFPCVERDHVFAQTAQV